MAQKEVRIEEEIEEQLIDEILLEAYLNADEIIKRKLKQIGYNIRESCGGGYYGDAGVGSSAQDSYIGYCAVHVIINEKEYHVWTDLKGNKLSVWLQPVKLSQI